MIVRTIKGLITKWMTPSSTRINSPLKPKTISHWMTIGLKIIQNSNFCDVLLPASSESCESATPYDPFYHLYKNGFTLYDIFRSLLVDILAPCLMDNCGV